MTWGYRRWFQDLINVWSMWATILKKGIHSQCRFCSFKKMYMVKTFVCFLSGYTSYFADHRFCHVVISSTLSLQKHSLPLLERLLLVRFKGFHNSVDFQSYSLLKEQVFG
jgi:hypothetical protein